MSEFFLFLSVLVGSVAVLAVVLLVSSCVPGSVAAKLAHRLVALIPPPRDKAE